MTDPVNYSEWQSGSIAPQIEGVYERRVNVMGGWQQIGLRRFAKRLWFSLPRGIESQCQKDTSNNWQWRGLV